MREGGPTSRRSDDARGGGPASVVCEGCLELLTQSLPAEPDAEEED